MPDWNLVAHAISAASGRDFNPRTPRNIGGGCINKAFQLSDGTQHWFVKTNRADRVDMFEAEFAALAEMAATATIRVPRPLCAGVCNEHSYLVMEYLELGGGGRTGHQQAGEQLAAMHRESAQAFGWRRDNTIGATPQSNAWSMDWIEFWRDQRLGFQFQLAARNGHGGQLRRLGDRLLQELPSLIDHDPRPSLLHGDLWGGNIGYTGDGVPVIFDPAMYYGDRESDLAMTELFGGFGTTFYDAYRAAWPLDRGYTTRKTLYNLYHILNHLNLFGGGYAGQALSMTERLLADL